MNQPKTQTDDPPTEGASPDNNPTGNTPHGIPKEMLEHDAKGSPTGDRLANETASLTNQHR